MIKQYLLWLTGLIFHAGLLANTDDIFIAKGSVLVYEVKEGSKSYLYTVTIQNWDRDAPLAFSWQTNEKPTPRKGIFKLDEYYDLGSETFFVGVSKTADHQFLEAESCIMAPSVLQEFLMEDSEEAEFTIVENGKKYSLSTKTCDIEDYQEKPLKYNGQPATGEYTHITNPEETIELGLLCESDNFEYLLAYYHSATLTMNLISVSTKVNAGPKPTGQTTPAPASGKALPQKMDAAKLTAVKKAFPVLATLESYDVTEGGKNEKPFSETYDFRLATGAKNPPSAIDCLTADLQIIFNQRKNFGLADMTETVSKNNLPGSAADKLLNIYSTYEATKIPGYKPWTHWKFVRGLSSTQRTQLAKDLEGYIKQYGFITE